MFVWNFMAIHLIVADICVSGPKWWADHETMPFEWLKMFEHEGKTPGRNVDIVHFCKPGKSCMLTLFSRKNIGFVHASDVTQGGTLTESDRALFVSHVKPKVKIVTVKVTALVTKWNSVVILCLLR